MWSRNHFGNYGNHSSSLMPTITSETFILSLGYWQFYYGLQTTVEGFMFYASLQQNGSQNLTSDNCEPQRRFVFPETRIASPRHFFLTHKKASSTIYPEIFPLGSTLSSHGLLIYTLYGCIVYYISY